MWRKEERVSIRGTDWRSTEQRRGERRRREGDIGFRDRKAEAALALWSCWIS